MTRTSEFHGVSTKSDRVRKAYSPVPGRSSDAGTLPSISASRSVIRSSIPRDAANPVVPNGPKAPRQQPPRIVEVQVFGNAHARVKQSEIWSDYGRN